MTTNVSKLTLGVFSLAAVLAGPVPPAYAGAALACGTELLAGTDTQLLADMECEEGPILIVHSKATLRLNGHTLRCTEFGESGIVIVGTRAVVLGPGNVADCNPGIVVSDGGKHTVDGVSVSGEENTSILVESDKNLVTRSSASGGYFGVRVSGNKNKIIDNDFSPEEVAIRLSGSKNFASANSVTAGSHGFSINGTKNKVSGNTVSETIVGIVVTGEGNKIIGNTVTNVQNDGIHITAASKIVGNTVTGSAEKGITVEAPADAKIKVAKNETSGNNPDLNDDTADCGAHKWKKNVYTTETVDCIP